MRFFILLFFCLGCSAMSKKTDIEQGKLSVCSWTPNCVSTFESRKSKKIEPLKYTNLEVAHAKVINAIKKMPRTKIITKRANYIHVEFTSKLMKFVDDVEFFFHKDGTLHLRSSSRVGISDRGVNRERIKKFKSLYNQ